MNEVTIQAIADEASGEPGVDRGCARLAAFSDGVLAIAITLLILEIRLPARDTITVTGGLGRTLATLWPSYAGYVISFLTIGIMWANHYNLMRLIARVDHGFVVWNLLLLMAISFTPFSTAVLAQYLPHPGADRRLAVAFYGLTFTLTAVCFNRLWHHASKGRRLIARHVSDVHVAAVTSAYRPGVLAYAAATIVSFVNVLPALIMVAGLAVFYILPNRGAHRAQRYS